MYFATMESCSEKILCKFAKSSQGYIASTITNHGEWFYSELGKEGG